MVIELLEFAMKFVNVELSPFFDEHCHLWDYDDDELKALFSGGGESLRQHDVYRDYVQLVNARMDDFVSTSGYASQKDVFAAVEAAVEKDREQRNRLMEEIQAMFRGSKDEAPRMIFSQPVGLEFLLESVLNIGEYDTLRMMMIMKVKERRLRKEISQKATKRRDDADKRKDDLRRGRLSECYDDLRTRLEELTPHNEQLHESIASGMSRRAFDDDVDNLRDPSDDPANPKLYDVPADHLIKLSSLACLNVSSELESKAADLRDARASHVAWLHLLHDTIDRICDDIDDRIISARRHASGGGSPLVSEAK